MKILAIGAHPDDIEFGVGGLIIKEQLKGTQIKIVICSLGEAGSNGTPVERKLEAIEAGKISGVADIEFLDMGGDCNIEYTPTNTKKLAKIIRDFKPEVVLTPEMQINQHPDHYTVSRLTHSACRIARYGGIKELKESPIHNVSSLFFYPSRAEWGNRPDLIVDVSENYELWMQAIQAHKSQMASKSYLNLITTKAAAWGASIGVKYAIGLWTNDPIRFNNLSDINLSSRNY